METIQRDQDQENILLNFFCFRNIFETAVRYWKLAFLCAILGGFWGFAATKWFIKPIYVSQSSVYSWRENSGDSRDSSNSVYRELSLALLLINDYRALLDSELVKDELRQQVRQDFTARFPEQSRNPKDLWYSTSIETRRDSRVLTIITRARTPQLAQYVADETAKIFSDTIKSVLQMDNVRIIDYAKLPGSPSNLSMRRNLPMGFFVGLVVGVALALLRGFIDQTIKNPEQAKRYLDIPVMGVIPKSTMPSSRTNFIRTMLDSGSYQELTEAYRLLRTNLQYFASSRSETVGGHVYMFTSSIPHEGKSTSISLVAVLTARAGKKVLLIDADMHKPVLSRIFGVRGGQGLVSVLTGDKKPEDMIFHIEEFLDVMPCGPVPPNPSELLMSERMPELIAELRKKYDYIFIDTTPALFLSDPLIIEPLADGVLFMIACSQAKIGLIQRTLRQLQQVSSKPIGAVVNKFDRGEVGNKYGYYGYYRYRNYYRYYRDYSHGTGSSSSSSGGEAEQSGTESRG